MPKDKYGNKLTWKEFGTRWKKGIEGVTPLQQTKMQMKSTWIIIIGITLGIFVCFLNLKVLWWVLIILIGALFNSLVQMVGIYQKKTALERIEQFSTKLKWSEDDTKDNLGDS